MLRFFEKLDSIGGWAALLFILVDMLVVVPAPPGVILSLGAGSIRIGFRMLIMPTF